MQAKSNTVSLLQYAFLALPLSFAGLPLYIHMPDFYARNIGINIGFLGIILMGIRLFDAVQDPFIGYVSDVYAKRRFTIITIGTVILVTGLGGLFYGPLPHFSTALWFATFMLLATTGFSVISININVIGGFWRSSSTDRTRISSAREGFALIGLLLAVLLPTILQRWMSSEASFVYMFWIFLSIIVLASIAFMRFMHTVSVDNTAIRDAQNNTDHKFSFSSILFGTDRIFFGICFLSQLAASIPAVLVLFFIRDYLGADTYAGLFLIIYFLSGAAFIGIWIWLSKRKGMYASWLISMGMSVAVFAWAYTLHPGDLVAYGAICALSGVALGADLALPPAMLADRINAQNTERKATQYYAVQSLIPKISMAFASGGAFIFLSAMGFETELENSPQAMHALVAVYALLPCIIKIISGLCLLYLIKKEGHNHETIERTISHGTTRNT